MVAVSLKKKKKKKKKKKNIIFFFFKQKTAYEMCDSDWSSDVCSSDLSLDHYNSLMETLHLLSTPANAEAMARAIRQDRAGEARPRALLDTDGA